MFSIWSLVWSKQACQRISCFSAKFVCLPLNGFNGSNTHLLYSSRFPENEKQKQIWVGRRWPVRFWLLFRRSLNPGNQDSRILNPRMPRDLSCLEDCFKMFEAGTNWAKPFWFNRNAAQTVRWNDSDPHKFRARLNSIKLIQCIPILRKFQILWAERNLD